MRSDAARNPNLLTDLADIYRRLLNLETSSNGRRTLDAAASDWEEQNPNWIEPDTVPLWIELRLKNTADGVGQIWRTVPTLDTTDPDNPITGAAWRRLI